MIDDENNNHKLTEYTKNRIIIYYNDHLSIEEISKKLCIHRHTVTHWINQYNEFGLEGLKRRIGSGTVKRKLKYKQSTDTLISEILNDKYATLRSLHEKLNKNGTNLSIVTIRKILIDSGYEYGHPPKRFPLTEIDKQRRIEFAIKYKNIDWDKVIFTDECSIWKGSKTLKRWFNLCLGTDSDVVYKHPDKINVWAAINSKGAHSIYLFKEILDAKLYVHVLKEKLLPLFKNGHYFQYDNDPKHTSNKAKNFIHKNKIQTVQFPAYSPDLNPVENIWGILKHRLQKISSFDDNYEITIINEWNKITQSVLTNTINTMPQRLELIIKNKGEHIY